MTPEVFYHGAGVAIAAGLLVGSLVSLFNSWTP